MVYVTVKEESDDILRLSREPSLRSWAISVGLVALGIGAAFYSADYLIWQLAYVSSALFVAISFMEDWEECCFDKTSGKVISKVESLLGRLVQWKSGLRSVSGDLSDLVDVKIEAEDIKYGTTAYTVVLKFSSGYSIGVTETATADPKSDHQQVAVKISKFLKLEEKASHSTITLTKEELAKESTDEEEVELEEEEEGEKTADESAHSDESFERIDKSDIPEDIVEVADVNAELPISKETTE
ncbi:hypothetical protein CAPTEDRAFT_220565 [Capitella teleta]|uniref:Essential for reactive oxygen species protein n=1 Tax=Capitella teleta TaxID=283909 RepID=R7TYG5_CAPTE|nr:hypothetical protein CAPTEDRAFT_220565 [Capitella teleta]|eukprot:ELT96466.1 hypothetical protein CAPTEDRAFT_220565 [Capitella teleta]